MQCHAISSTYERQRENGRFKVTGLQTFEFETFLWLDWMSRMFKRENPLLLKWRCVQNSQTSRLSRYDEIKLFRTNKMKVSSLQIIYEVLCERLQLRIGVWYWDRSWKGRRHCCLDLGPKLSKFWKFWGHWIHYHQSAPDVLILRNGSKYERRSPRQSERY